MRTIGLRHPAGIASPRSVDLPDPEQRAHGQIRVRLHASSHDFHDLGIVLGQMPAAHRHIPMSDGVGVVEAVGPQVSERLEQGGRVVEETDITDIGTGSYTIIAQTAAEIMGVPSNWVHVRLGGASVNHDLAGYEVPVHADIPHQEVMFLEESDPPSSPMKAKGVGELGIFAVAAVIANAGFNATGVRAGDYPVTLDKLRAHLPELRCA
ncbi:molybdopterin cofactor-binding domain-containing protein [Xanthomonas fragariae]|uniref:molybdopterin cofactor-binding domain-containing protein n=1 Tax=Xanthomonas fragariae TaxID=48664 RepID=UPI000A35D39E|nr:oxidoreductase [Xanthomonas fragariae]